MRIFKNKEQRVIKVIEKAMPAVVSIAVSEKDKTEKSSSNHFSLEKADSSQDFINGGSGFIIEEKGIVLTNRHVVSGKDIQCFITLGSGEKFKAELIARDPLDDLAILQFNSNGKNLPVIPLGDSNKVKLGETVLALGNVLGFLKNTVSAGIISGLSRSITAQIEKNTKPSEMRGLIQTDAAINPGNSGGPLINLSGRAIGISVATVAGLENIGFALPIDIVKRDLNEFKKHNRITRSFLGIRYLTINEDASKEFSLPVKYGALIIKGHSFDTAVVEKSPADKAGIKEKDIILEWNGDKITSDKNIQDYLSNSQVGDKVVMKILRDGKKFERTLTLTERM